MTEAKKRYGARVCYAFKSNIDKKSRTIKEGDEYTYKGINLYVYITSKKEPDKVKISISLEDLVFNEDSSGKQYYDGKAINPYLKYCTENRIGKYALLDMAKGEVEKTNLFYPLLQKKCPYIYGKPVVASKDEIKEILSFFNEVIAIRDNEDIEFAKEWAKSLAMDTKAWLERSNEFCEEKREKLINKVDEVCKLVESKLSNV